MGTGSFQELSCQDVVLTTHPPSSAEVKERRELYVYSPLWAFVACSRVKFTFFLVVVVVVVVVLLLVLASVLVVA